MFMDRRAPRELWHVFVVLGGGAGECDNRNAVAQLKRDKSGIQRLYIREYCAQSCTYLCASWTRYIRHSVISCTGGLRVWVHALRRIAGSAATSDCFSMKVIN